MSFDNIDTNSPGFGRMNVFDQSNLWLRAQILLIFTLAFHGHTSSSAAGFILVGLVVGFILLLLIETLLSIPERLMLQELI